MNKGDKIRINNVIRTWERKNKTSWKYLKNKGLRDAEYFGDCIFLSINSEAIELDAIKDLKERLYRALS